MPAPPLETGWAPDESWWTETSLYGSRITRANGTSLLVRARHARNLHEVARKIQEQSGIAARIAFVDLDELNAFAIDAGSVRQIAFTFPLLEAIGDDRDALATTIGHEAAHLHYAHETARRGRDRLIMGDPASIRSILTVNSTYSRYEEREADDQGMAWAVAAGFSACGAARTMRAIRAREPEPRPNSFLSRHPGHGERIARATDLASRLDGRGC